MINSSSGRQVSEKKIDHLLAERNDLLWQLQWARYSLRQIAHADISKSQMKEEAQTCLAIMKNYEKHQMENK